MRACDVKVSRDHDDVTAAGDVSFTCQVCRLSLKSLPVRILINAVLLSCYIADSVRENVHNNSKTVKSPVFGFWENAKTCTHGLSDQPKV